MRIPSIIRIQSGDFLKSSSIQSRSNCHLELEIASVHIYQRNVMDNRWFHAGCPLDLWASKKKPKVCGERRLFSCFAVSANPNLDRSPAARIFMVKISRKSFIALTQHSKHFGEISYKLCWRWDQSTASRLNSTLWQSTRIYCLQGFSWENLLSAGQLKALDPAKLFDRSKVTKILRLR